MKNAKKRKHTKVTKHAHRKAMIAEKKSKGKYSHPHLPTPEVCQYMSCYKCWANPSKCGSPYLRYR